MFQPQPRHSTHSPTESDYTERRWFGLWKIKKKNHTIRNFFCGLYLWKKSTKERDLLEKLRIDLNAVR